MNIAISSNHGDNTLRKEITSLLDELGHTYQDFGPQTSDSVDYPDYAGPVSEGVATGKFDRGILICGTGIGMSIQPIKLKESVVHWFTMFSAQKRHVDIMIPIY